MSYALGVSPRLRWAYESLILKEWLVAPLQAFKPSDAICVLTTAGADFEYRAETVEPGWLIRQETLPGEEVPVWGYIGEWSVNGAFVRPPDHLPRHAVGEVAIAGAKHPVMISYRREDTEGFAARLHEYLESNIGEGTVFFDQFSIPPGSPWEEAIHRAAVTCKVMLVMIGKRWSDAEPGRDEPRYSSEFDLVHREIVCALDRRAIVVPVLVQNIALPDRMRLPHDMYSLLRYQAMEITTPGWKVQAATLRERVFRILQGGPA